MSDTETGGRAGRPWWRMKRWWVGALPIVWAVYFFTPYSINGPAAPCHVIKSRTAFPEAVYNFSKNNNYSQYETIKYIENSGYKLLGVSIFEENTIRLGYGLDGLSIYCFPLFDPIDGYLIGLYIYNDPNSNFTAVRDVKSNYSTEIRDMKKR